MNWDPTTAALVTLGLVTTIAAVVWVGVAFQGWEIIKRAVKRGVKGAGKGV